MADVVLKKILEAIEAITSDINVDTTSVSTSGLIGKPTGCKGDFVVTRTSATDITCSNLPAWYPDLTANDIETIRQIDSVTGAEVNTYSRDDIPMSVTANVITVTGAVFAVTDIFVVFTNVDEMNYRLKYLAENIGSLHEMIQACNDSSRFNAYGDAANLADDANHITGAVSVLWDKTGGTNVSSGVEDTITSMDLSAFSPSDYVMVTVYIPDLVDVDSVGLILGTDPGNYGRWEWPDTDLVAGAWNVLIAPVSGGEMLGLGWDQSAITWLAFEVIFDNAADTLNAMMIDQISIISAESIGIAMESGTIDPRTQRMTIATDDTVATDLTAILAALLLRMPSDGVTHRSPQDFSAAYTSSTTLTLAGAPTITNNAQIVKVVQIKADNTSAEWKQGINCTLKVSGGVITIYGAGTPFVTADEYAVCLSIQQKAFDLTQDVKKFIEQAPDWDHFVGPEDLISSAQVLTTAFADLGNEISMKTFNQLGFFPTIDINDANDIEFRFLHKVESGGAEEYREITLGSPVAGITTINLNDYQIGDDNDQLFKLNIPTANTTHYMQVQARMKTDGGVDAQITACVITKAWSRS
jgi:hypothetical protein